MPNGLLTTAQILLVVVTPLLVLYLRGNWPLRSVITCLLLIPVLWYLTYAPLHELSHIVGTFLAGGRVVDYKLIPEFWAGEFAVAWITPVGLTRPWQNLVMSSAPYVVDLASIVTGMIVLRRRLSGKASVVGLVFMLLCLRPAFDLVCESVAFLTGFRGDLYNIALIVGSPVTWSIVLISLVLSLLSVLTILKRYGGFPEDVPAHGR